MADLFWRQTKKPGRSASESSSNGSKPVKTPDSSSFTKFEDQTKDAWDCADDEVVTFSFDQKHIFQLIKTFGVDPDTSRRTAKQVLTRYDETGEPPLTSKRKSNQHKNSNGASSSDEKPKPTTLDTSGPIVVSPGKVIFFVRRMKCTKLSLQSYNVPAISMF